MRIPIARLTVVGLSIVLMTGCRSGGGLAKAWPWGKKSASEPAVASAPKSSYADTKVELPSEKAKPTTLAGISGESESSSTTQTASAGTNWNNPGSYAATDPAAAYNAYTNNAPSGTSSYNAAATDYAATGANAYNAANSAYAAGAYNNAYDAANTAYGAAANAYGDGTAASPASFQPRYGQEYNATAAGTSGYGTTGYDANAYGNTAYNTAGAATPAYGTTTPAYGAAPGYGTTPAYATSPAGGAYGTSGVSTADARNSMVPPSGGAGWDQTGTSGASPYSNPAATTNPAYGGSYPATGTSTPAYNTGAAANPYGASGGYPSPPQSPTGYDPGNMSDNKPMTVGQYNSPYATSGTNLAAGSSTDYAPGSTGRFNGTTGTTPSAPYGGAPVNASVPGMSYQ